MYSTTAAGGGSNLKLQYKQITNALTGDYEGLHVRASTDVGSAANAVNGAQIKAVANDVASQLTVSALRGVYASVDSKDNLVTTARAFEASLDGLAGSTITEAVGIELMNNSSGTQTASYGLSINGGTPTGHKVYTADMRLQNGATVNNSAAGKIVISGLSSTATSGDLIGLQLSPSQGADTTGEVFGAQIKPRVASTFNAATVNGLGIDSELKGPGDGALSSDLRGINLYMGATGTGTIGGNIVGLRARLESAINPTGHAVLLLPVDNEGAQDWDGLIKFDAALGTHGMTTSSDKTGNAKSGTIKVIGSDGTVYHIQLYAD